MVNSALQSHQALSLKRLTISFYANKSAQSEVAKWVEFGRSRRVKVLDFDLRCLSPTYAVVLGEVLGEMTAMSHLKRLCLKTLNVSGEDISLLLRSCPLLRELRIRSLVLTSDLHLCGAALNLEIFDMCHCVSEKPLITVSAPNLTSVKVEARPGKLMFQNVPKLVKAGFRIVSRKYAVEHFASATSCFLSQLQKLKLTLFHPKFHGELKDAAVSDMEVGINRNVSRCGHPHLETFEFRGSCCASRIIQLATYISGNCVALRQISLGLPAKSELRADRDHLKQQLQPNIPHHIQLRVFMYR